MINMVDERVNQQVLGSLMKHPQYLSQTDRYTLTPSDFATRFEKYIFSAIYGLYFDGAATIHPIDVSNYLSSDNNAKYLFEIQNGVSYLNDIEDFCDENNFDYYYKKLKKLDLLRDLQKSGIDVSEFYIEDPLDARAAEVNKKFEELSSSDIITKIKAKILHLQQSYVNEGVAEVQSAIEGIDELVQDLGENMEIGLPLQGHIYNEIVNGAQRGKLHIRTASSGTGKAIPDTTIIPTPYGDKMVKDIKVGDYLWGDDGLPTKVIGVHPQPDLKEIYKVYFKDGRIAECCKDHLWGYYNAQAKNKYKINVANTQELLNSKLIKTDGGIHYSVPLNHAINYPEQDLYPSPYAMGALIGDGSFRYWESQKALTISGEDEEIIALTADGLNAKYEKNNADNFTWTFKLPVPKNNRVNLWVEEALYRFPKLWNLKSEEKFIPDEYLTGSINQRYELLQGLLDTDGSIDNKGRISYSTNSYKLVKQVQSLCWSLGFIAIISEDRHKDTSVMYVLHIQCSKADKVNLFKLTRKKQRAQIYANNSNREERRDNNGIIKIEPTGIYTSMTCFTVDNESHLFLMNDYIVTHNTRLAVGDACQLAYPCRFDWSTMKWIVTGSTETVLFIATEQSFREIRKLILAYLSGIPESEFAYANFSPRQEQILQQSVKIMKQYENNFHIIRMPDPNIELIKTMVRENCILHDIHYVFYDYIFVSNALIREFNHTGLRNDEALLLLSTALKDLAVELNVFVSTSTQSTQKEGQVGEIKGA